MGEQLAIHRFGPIQEAIIEPRPLTIFVGPQASGKSLVAQALYFLRGGLEEQLPSDITNAAEAVQSALERWFGCIPQQYYTREDSRLSWIAKHDSAEQQISWNSNTVTLSTELEQRVEQWLRFHELPKLQLYIPAGRSLYSFVPPHASFDYMRLMLRSNTQLPGAVSSFYSALGGAITALWQEQQRRDQGTVSMFEYFEELQRLRQRMEQVTKGQLRYGRGTVALIINKKLFEPTLMSAGQMESWPFLAIAEAIISGYATYDRLYFEEPEAHLHPGAQRIVMDIIAQMVNRGGQFVITTHSPYLLYAVNNFLMAGQVLARSGQLPEGVDTDTALTAAQVAVYRFSPDGQVFDVMDHDVGLIDAAELEHVADDLGALFANLQDLLE